jgi:uncharacterized membrane protein
VTAPPQESQGRRPPFTSAGSAGVTRAVTTAASETDSPEVEARAADRVIVFSDAVVAIAITLLALALPVPDSTNATTNGQFLDKLGGSWGEYFAFLISFAVIGSDWAAHRRTFRYVNRLNIQVRRLNMIWLLMMILTPFVARMLGAGHGGFGVRYMLYTLVQVIAAACVVAMNREISRENLLRPDAPAAARHPDNLRYLTVIVTFLVSIPVAFATPWAFALWAAVPVLPRVLRRRMTSGRHAANDADHNRVATAAQGSGGPHHLG